MKFVTVGGGFLDIDGLGAGVAYAELLSKQGVSAAFVCTGPMNGSVTPTIRSWDLPVVTEYTVNNDDRFVVVDNSEPAWLEAFVTEDKIDEIIDHHLGREAYWRERGVTADIEFVGACCTQIYERWVLANRLDDISETSARLLMCGILDNTLDFKASVTTQRDLVAYNELLQRSGLGADWPQQYFKECQVGIEQDIEAALVNDTKRDIDYPGYSRLVTISQIAVWNGKELLEKKDELMRLTEHYGPERSIHILSIEEGKNYFVTPSSELRDFFETLLGCTYKETLAIADRLWLRKEIMKKAIDNGRIS